jgi:hypothetical protein
MSIESDQFLSDAVRRAQQLQRLNVIAVNQAMGHYLRGCANLAMARTPEQAMAALHKTQTDLLGHSVRTIAEAAKLLFK